MQRTLLLVGLVLVAGLTGCLGGEQDPADEPAAPDGPDGPGPEEGAGARNATLLTYPNARAVFGIAWANDTFSLEDSDQLVGPARELPGQQERNRHRVDITDRVPGGVPSFVAVEIQAEVGRGDVDVWLEAPDTAIWTSEVDAPFGGYSRIEHILVRPEATPLTVVVQLDEVPDRSEVPYTLAIDVRSNPGLALPGAPVSFQAGPDHRLRLESLDDGGEIDVLLFDPQDRFLQRIQGKDTAELLMDDQAPAGRYVMMVAQGIRPVWPTLAPPPGEQLEDASLGVLEQEITLGEPQPFQDDGSVAWSFQVDQPPLQAGILVQSQGVGQDLETGLAGPEGQLFTAQVQGGPWVQPGFVFLTDMGDPGLQAGTYQAQATFGVAASPEADASAILVGYAR